MALQPAGRFFRLRLFCACVVLTGSLSSAGDAQPSAIPGSDVYGFDRYRVYLADRARREGISEPVASQVLGLRLNDRAIALDRAQQPGPATVTRSPALMPYVRRHVTPTLIWRGQALYHSRWPQLVAIEARHGVDPATLLAIFGKETSYGRVTGNFDILEVLASLAWEGRRRSLFEPEVIAALKLLDSGVSRSLLRGSYAGATGFPQFMPSAVLRLRADGDGDGIADIWGSEPDALASIAAFLGEAGWKRGLAWGAPARVPPTLDRSAIARTGDARCNAERRHSREMTIAQWRTLGVTPVGRTLPDAEPASLIEPEGAGETPYLLTRNYRADLAYNCSNLYAMSVVLLSDAIARR